MDKVVVNVAYCISAFLDIKSIYCFLRCQKRLFPLWFEEYLWTFIISRETPSVLTLRSDPKFTIEDCSEFKPYIWTKHKVSSPKSFLIALFGSFRHIAPAALNGIAQSSFDFTSDISYTVSYSKDLFWSSLGSTAPQTEDYLRYSLESSTIIFWVEIKLHIDPREYLFPPQQYRLKIGMNDTCWDYISEPVTAAATGSAQFLIVLPRLVAGRVIQVEFVGKMKKHYCDRLYRVLVGKIRCVGVPAVVTEDGIELGVDPTQPQITTENYKLWIQRLVHYPSIVNTELLKALLAVGAVREYFEAIYVQRNHIVQPCESEFLLSHYEAIKGIFTLPYLETHCSETIGDVLFAKGEIVDACRFFSLKHDIEKMVKCLLLMENYRKCAEMIAKKTILREIAMKIAEEIGGDAEANFEEYLNRRAQKKRKRRKTAC